MMLDKNELTTFFGRVGNQEQSKKLKTYMADKSNINLSEFKKFWSEEIRAGASEGCLINIISEMIATCKPVEMNIDSVLNQYQSQQSLRSYVKQNSIKQNLKSPALSNSLAESQEEQMVQAQEFDPTRVSQNMMLQMGRFTKGLAKGTFGGPMDVSNRTGGNLTQYRPSSAEQREMEAIAKAKKIELKAELAKKEEEFTTLQQDNLHLKTSVIPEVERKFANLYQKNGKPNPKRGQLMKLDREITAQISELIDLKGKNRRYKEDKLPQEGTTMAKLVQILAEIEMMKVKKNSANTACEEYYGV